MNDAEEQTAATLAKLHGPHSWPRRILTVALWFGLPFAAMASLGVPIERAAQAAIFPWACSAISLVFVLMCITVIGWCIVSVGQVAADEATIVARIEHERKRAIRRRDDATTPEASDGWALVLSTLNRIKEPTDV